ncbi:hypothetical protein LUZ61_013965 [Rhynchospora tenuis]|uniref:non-specific serine/threonine protein kinase n=1 Tax=Rhynchospora tenuis TaxID=198213 RepID=A0AAD5Z301_9POAL|nr:hypothetical protein LUZ61_013965 [Rhynchospora tenuis]
MKGVHHTMVTMFGLLNFLFFSILPAMAGDLDLLISFKNSLANPSLLSDWNHAKGVCNFPGVACKEGYVSSLIIRDLPLGADFVSVSAHILSLPNLESLSLHSINLTGSITVPAKCTVQLKKLDLSSNDLRGSVSDAASLAASYPSVQSLNLSNNSIGQAFDHSYPFIPNLKMLDLSYNKIATNKDLQWLFSKLELLQHLDLSNNNIPGDIPILPLLSMRRLELLDLSFNNFNGSLPKSISKLTSLELLNLSANMLSGQIPHSLCTQGVSSLKWLYLLDNFLTGYIPESLSNCTKLVSLDLSLNLLSGSIPDSLGSLSNLKYLMMWQNNLNGEIPRKLSSLRSLRNLVLDYNNLTATIPDGLVNCTSLNWISLASNRLTGSIPIWIGKLEKLVILILRNNSFTGLIPPELGDCKGLVYLQLSSNQLNGSIPTALAKQSGKIVVDLVVDGWPVVTLAYSSNTQCYHKIILVEFNGIRYEDLMHMPSTRYCNFSRIYRYSTGNLHRNNELTMIYLDLSYNQLTGNIPTEISTMRSLQVLNLEHNQLSGPLPHEMGGLTHLFVLYLSNNMLDGMIPSSFSGLSLSVIDLSNNRLSGPIPEWGSLATFPESAFENNSGLCGFPMPPCNGGSTSKGDVRQQHVSSQVWWIALGLLFSFFLIIGFVIGLLVK